MSLMVSEATPQNSSVELTRPEVLAPAGDADCLRAAIENGADAVYFGLKDHNARARATNFDLNELPEIMCLLHRRGVRGYVALNTLVFSTELDNLEPIVERVAQAGADAIIVQDLGLIRLARAICPALAIHASTQMTITSAESIRLIEDLGVERVILARELSLEEIARIRNQTQMPLEVFVHGALCVAYSGQCLTSEALGGRSANRGQCAQACRLPYELICDGKPRDLAEVQYLLSPQDLAAYALVPDLVKLGVSGLKIEGRLKTPEYVANITRHYRMAVDEAVAGRPVVFTRRQVEEMELSFSRGFSVGWLHGNNHKVLVQGRNPRKHGLLIGQVQSVRGHRVLVQLTGSLKRGDGVVFDCGRPDEPEQGGRVYEIYRGGESMPGPVETGIVQLGFGRGAVDLTKVQPGNRVWKTDDPDLTRRLRRSFTGSDAKRRVALDLNVTAKVGVPLRVQARAESGATAEVISVEPLAPANRHPITAELLHSQLGRLGATIYTLRSINSDIQGQPMVPLSVLGTMRHELVRQLDRSIAESPQRRIAGKSQLVALRGALKSSCAVSTDESQPHCKLHVMCRSMEQLKVALRHDVNSVYVDFQDIREYSQAVRLAHEVSATIFLATPRIQKPAEANLFKHLLRHGSDGILVRNLGALRFYAERQVPIVADFSINASNELTVDIIRQEGARRVTASYDLNAVQLRDLVAAVPPAWLEIVMHQHMPMFHMEHCVFCAFLSPGSDRTNCGRPCDRHEVRLRDRVGMEHPLKADVGCRNTLFNAVPQSAAEQVTFLIARGMRHFRIELLDETPATLRETIDLYRKLLAGNVTGRDVWTRLRATNRFGVTRGPLEH
jgi:putative protease